VYKKFVGQIAYNLGSIGKLALTYRGGLNEAVGDASKLFAYFGITAIENLGIDLGVGYTLPVTYTPDPDQPKFEETYTAPVALGLGVNFTTGALGIKARVQGVFGEKWTPINSGNKGDPAKGTMIVLADLLPSFAVTDKVSAYLDTGLAMYKNQAEPPKGETYDAVVGWHIMPYVSVKANAWAPNFYAGFRFESAGGKNSDTGKDNPVFWSVPIGMWLTF
jgi:hypothetical protein